MEWNFEKQPHAFVVKLFRKTMERNQMPFKLGEKIDFFSKKLKVACVKTSATEDGHKGKPFEVFYAGFNSNYKSY